MSTKRKIINLRGANGSGKTSVARAILNHALAPASVLFEYDSLQKRTGKTRRKSCLVTKCMTPWSEMPVYVIGRYEGVQNGGWDLEGDMEAIEMAMRSAVFYSNLTDGHIFFEGFIISKSGKRWMNFAKDHVGRFDYTWGFIELPLETLKERIMGRNGGKEPKMHHLENTAKTVKSIQGKVLDTQGALGKVCVFNDSSATPVDIAKELIRC